MSHHRLRAKDPLERLALRVLRSRGWRSHRVETSVGPIHALETQGKGARGDWVLIHGFGASGYQFAPLARLLRPEVSRLLVPDLPAHGASAVPHGGMHPDTLHAGFFEAMDAMIQKPSTLVGNSMGGYAAIRFALERPEKVSRLILCSPGGAQMTEAELIEFKKVFDVVRHKDAALFVDRLLGRRSPLRHLLAFNVKARLSRPEMRTLMGLITPERLLDPAQLAQLKMPILMVWGANDGILPEYHRHFFERHLPAHAQVVVPPRVGHSPHLDAPKLLAREFLRFTENAPA